MQTKVTIVSGGTSALLFTETLFPLFENSSVLSRVAPRVLGGCAFLFGSGLRRKALAGGVNLPGVLPLTSKRGNFVLDTSHVSRARAKAF